MGFDFVLEFISCGEFGCSWFVFVLSWGAECCDVFLVRFRGCCFGCIGSAASMLILRSSCLFGLVGT